MQTVKFGCDPNFSLASLFIQYCNDIVIYNKKYIFGPCPVSGHRAPKTFRNFLSNESSTATFCYINELTQDPTQGWGLGEWAADRVFRGLELPVSSP